MAMLVQFFMPSKLSRNVYNGITDWVQIIFAFAVIVGVFGILKYHLEKMGKRQAGWTFNFITIAAVVIMTVLGFALGRKDDSPFMWAFNYIQAPMQASVFSLLAFFVASAAYRGFTARNTEALFLLLSAVFIMFGIASLGNAIPPFSDIASWILMNPSMAARRGIYIGIGLGVIATSLRVILGVERTYLGKE